MTWTYSPAFLRAREEHLRAIDRLDLLPLPEKREPTLDDDVPSWRDSLPSTAAAGSPAAS